MKIKHQFSALLVFFCLLLLGLLSYLSAKGTEVLEKQYLGQFERESVTLIDMIERNLFERYHDARTFTLFLANPTEQQYHALSGSQRVTNILNTYVVNYKVYRHLLLLDTQGNLIVSNSVNSKGATTPQPQIDAAHIRQMPWFKEALEGRFLSDDATIGTVVFGPQRNLLIPQNERKDTFEMVFATQILSPDNEVVGIWASIVDFGQVESIVAKFYQRLSSRGFYDAELTILDKQGNIIVNWHPVEQLQANYQRDFNILGQLNLAEQGLSSARLAVVGQNGAEISTHIRKKIKHLSGFSHSSGAYDYPGLGWSALISVPLKDVFSPLHDLYTVVILGFLLLALAVFLAAIWLSNRISQPLLQSTTALKQMASGNMAFTIPEHSSNDEIGDINRALTHLKLSLEEKAQLELQTEEQKHQLVIYERAVNATTTGIVVCDVNLPDCPLIFVNRAFEQLTGYSQEEVLGKNCRFLQGEKTEPQSIAQLRDAIVQGISCNLVMTNYRKNGDKFYNNLRVDPLFDEQGQLTHFTGVLSDITEFKHHQELAQLRLENTVKERTRISREAENRFRAIFDTSIDGMMVLENKGMIRELNHSAELILGRNKKALVDCVFTTLIANEYQQSISSLFDGETAESQVFESGRTQEIEFIHKNGRHFPAELAIGTTEVDNQLIFVAVFRDISERQAAEQVQIRLQGELIEREQIYRAAFDQAAVGIARVSTEGSFLEVNEKLCEIVGYPRNELLRNDFQSITHIDDLEKDVSLHQQLLDDQLKTYRIDKRYYRKNGEEVWINLSVSLVRDKHNEPKYFISIVEDINDRKKFETQLQLAKKKHQELLRGQSLASVAGGICYWSWDLEKDILLWDKEIYQIYGLPEDIELTLDAWKKCIHPKDLAATEQGLRLAIEEHHAWSAEYRILHHQTGQTRWVKAAADVQLDDKGKPIKLFGVKLDISEERLIQLALEKETKAAQQASDAKSRFLATMSHEIRTPINSVIGMIDLLRDTRMSADQQKMARTIRDAAFSLLDIINDILDFSKIEAGQMALELVSTDVNDVLERCAEALWIHAEKLNVKLYITPDLAIPSQLRLDVVRLRQMILNLLGNAIKFSHGLQRQGEIILSSKLLSQDNGKVRLSLSVSDNGIGLTNAQTAKLFQPFHQADTSTTRRYGGTGLGLSITKALVEMMKGHISIDSRFGFGSTFTITLECESVSNSLSDLTEVELSGLSMLICVDDDKLAGIIGDIIDQFECPITRISSKDINKVIGTKAINECDIVIVDQLSILKKMQNLHENCADKTHHIGYLLMCEDPSTEKGLVGESHFTIGHHPFKPSELVLGCAIAAGRESPVIERLMIESLYSESEKAQDIHAEKPTVSEHLILVAEDQPTNREVIKRQLDKLGYRCDIADDGLEALERWHSGDYDLLLTDCHMPNLDGFELTAKIRQVESDDPNQPRIPIIAVTANALAGEAEHCLQAGMDDYLAKPVELPKLAKLLKHWLSQPQTQFEGAIVVEKPLQQQPIDFKRLSNILGTDDIEILHSVLNSFWQSVQNDMPQIQLAIDTQQSNSLREKTHAAKGAARSSGAEPLAAVMQELELLADAQDWQAADQISNKMQQEVENLRSFLTTQAIIE